MGKTELYTILAFLSAVGLKLTFLSEIVLTLAFLGAKGSKLS